MKNNTMVIYGPPGTGKTTKLIEILDEHLSRGVKPEKVAFLAFTKKAAMEAKNRVMDKYGFKDRELPYFRTLHSFAFLQNGLNREQVVQKKNYIEIGNELGIEVKGSQYSIDDEMYGMAPGDRLFFVESLARNKLMSIHSILDEDYRHEFIDERQLKMIAGYYRRYKSRRGLVDFTDMLYMFVDDCYIPEFDVLFIDEAQDLSPIQWEAVRCIMRRSTNIYIAGDDDQAIFKWAGADVQQFIDMEGERVVLDKSHRVPKSIQKIADSITDKIKNRVSKDWSARDTKGRVDYEVAPDFVNMDKGQWLLLARNGHMLRKLEHICRERGYSYDSVYKSPRQGDAYKSVVAYERYRKGVEPTKAEVKLISRFMSKKMQGKLKTMAYKPVWHTVMDRMPFSDKEYIINARRRGEKLIGAPRIQISTIHSVKGGEADNVMLLTDMSSSTYETFDRNPDDEHRVFYVAVTRAKERLVIVAPQSTRFYPL